MGPLYPGFCKVPAHDLFVMSQCMAFIPKARGNLAMFRITFGGLGFRGADGIRSIFSKLRLTYVPQSTS